MWDLVTLTPEIKEVYFGIVKYPPGGHLGPRIQRGVEFVYLISGSVVITVDGKREVLKPGHMALMLPNKQESYQFHSERESEHSWCQLDFHQLPVDLIDGLSQLPRQIPVTAEMEQLMELGLSLTSQREMDHQGVLVKLGETLTQYYQSIGALGVNERPQSVSRVVRTATHFMTQNLSEAMALEDIATASHCSVNHLINQFNQSHGVTPMRFLWRLRVERGASLLRHTPLSIAIIAEQCGFSSQFHFSRQFKQHLGCTPSQYRTQRRLETNQSV